LELTIMPKLPSTIIRTLNSPIRSIWMFNKRILFCFHHWNLFWWLLSHWCLLFSYCTIDSFTWFLVTNSVKWFECSRFGIIYFFYCSSQMHRHFVFHHCNIFISFSVSILSTKHCI
jgi:hypothetical protein